jgi:hypothetical protein
MFDFQSLLGKPSQEEKAETDFAAGFAEGVGLSHRILVILADERETKGDAFVDGVLLALQAEL